MKEKRLIMYSGKLLEGMRDLRSLTPLILLILKVGRRCGFLMLPLPKLPPSRQPLREAIPKRRVLLLLPFQVETLTH